MLFFGPNYCFWVKNRLRWKNQTKSYITWTQAIAGAEQHIYSLNIFIKSTFKGVETQFYVQLRPKNNVFEVETHLNYAKTDKNYILQSEPSVKHGNSKNIPVFGMIRT